MESDTESDSEASSIVTFAPVMKTMILNSMLSCSFIEKDYYNVVCCCRTIWSAMTIMNESDSEASDVEDIHN